MAPGLYYIRGELTYVANPLLFVNQISNLYVTFWDQGGYNVDTGVDTVYVYMVFT